MVLPHCDNCNLDPHGYGLLCLGHDDPAPAQVVFLPYPQQGQTSESAWINLSVAPHGVVHPGLLNLRGNIVSVSGKWPGNGVFFKQRWVLDLGTNTFVVQPGDDISVRFSRRFSSIKVPGRLLPGC